MDRKKDLMYRQNFQPDNPVLVNNHFSILIMLERCSVAVIPARKREPVVAKSHVIGLAFN